MRLWGELVLFIIGVIIIAVIISSIFFSNSSTVAGKLLPAEWVAADYTVGNETVIIVELRRPVMKNSNEFVSLDKREVGRIVNGQQDYDQLYYDWMQIANNRASVLNALHR